MPQSAERHRGADQENTKDQTLVEQMQTLERLGVYYKTAGVNIAEDILPSTSAAFTRPCSVIHSTWHG